MKNAPDSLIEICGEKALDGIFISVNNKGNIIPAREINELFKPFQRSKSALQSDTKGWGLGLSLVKGIAEAHGGAVKVLSNDKDGTTFIVFLSVDAREKQKEIKEKQHFLKRELKNLS